MKKSVFAAIFGLCLAGSVSAQTYQSQSDAAIAGIVEDVQVCFADIQLESSLGECLDYIDNVIEARGAFDHSQNEMNLGAVDIERAFDFVLNSEYQITIKRLRAFDDSGHGYTIYDPATAKNEPHSFADALRAAQRAWVPFRDAECVSRSGHSAGGSMYGMDFAFCRADMTRKRIVELILLRMGAYGGEEYFSDEFRYSDFL